MVVYAPVGLAGLLTSGANQEVYRSITARFNAGTAAQPRFVAASLWKRDRGALRAPRKLEQYADWLQRQLHGAPVRDLRVVASVSQVILQIPLRLRVQWQAALRAAGVDPRIDPPVPRAKVDSNHDAASSSCNSVWMAAD